MGVHVDLYVEGDREQVSETLQQLQDTLGEYTVVWWRGDQGPPGPDGKHLPYDPFATVEIQGSDRRVDAQKKVADAVRQVDPELKVITGGDIFKKPIREVTQ
jgi:hypothetical protein